MGNLEKRLWAKKRADAVAHVVPIPQDGGAGDDERSAQDAQGRYRRREGQNDPDGNDVGGHGAKGGRRLLNRTGNRNAWALIRRTFSGACGAMPA